MITLEFASSNSDNAEWRGISLDTHSVDGKHAAEVLLTESSDLAGAINEVLARQIKDYQEIQMVLSMGGVL